MARPAHGLAYAGRAALELTTWTTSLRGARPLSGPAAVAAASRSGPTYETQQPNASGTLGLAHAICRQEPWPDESSPVLQRPCSGHL